MNKKNPPNAMVRDESTSILLSNLRDLIQSARQRALRAVDTVQVQTCWEIGRHIVEFEQGGSARAEYGSQLLQTLAAALAAEFGRGFDISNLRYMRLFYHALWRWDVVLQPKDVLRKAWLAHESIAISKRKKRLAHKITTPSPFGLAHAA
jgi:hypothetical protein